LEAFLDTLLDNSVTALITFAVISLALDETMSIKENLKHNLAFVHVLGNFGSETIWISTHMTDV
jgi:hypothetical protein